MLYLLSATERYAKKNFVTSVFPLKNFNFCLTMSIHQHTLDFIFPIQYMPYKYNSVTVYLYIPMYIHVNMCMWLCKITKEIFSYFTLLFSVVFTCVILELMFLWVLIKLSIKYTHVHTHIHTQYIPSQVIIRKQKQKPLNSYKCKYKQHVELIIHPYTHNNNTKKINKKKNWTEYTISSIN